MFWLWRKNEIKNAVNKETGKIEKLCVVCKKFSYYIDYWRVSKNLRTLDNVLCFDLNVEKHLYYPYRPYHKVPEQLEPIYQDFILTANQRFCSDCYWHIITIGEHVSLSCRETEEESIEMAETLLAASPLIFHTETYHSFMELRLTNMESSIFEILSCSKFPDGEKLYIDVFDTSITAYHPQNREQLDADEDIGFPFNYNEDDKKFELHIDRSKIAFSPRRYDDVKSCLIEVFTKHDIELEFIDKIEKTKKGQ